MPAVLEGGTLRRSAYPPIGEYAFLSDCEVTALVAPSGKIEWMCLPRMDGPSIFGAILDRDAGSFRVSPVGQRVPTGRRYLPGTMILETTWGTRTGWVVVEDLLLIGPWHHDTDRSTTHRRSPTDTDADHVLLRMMRCVNGHVEMHVECEPKLDYGRRSAIWRYDGEGYGRAVTSTAGHAPELALTTDLRLGIGRGRARARTTLYEGDTAYVALTWTEHAAPASYDEAHRRMRFTADYWHDWLAHGNFPDHPWRTFLERSALTLKGLTYAPTGAMCAAATTSLPEDPGGERNWDYRYSWVRDSSFILWALHSLGFEQEAVDYYSFIEDVASGDRDLQVLYGVGGERELTEHELDHLEGYDHSRPVRIGNAAYSQNQHDIWGVLLDSVYIHAKYRDQLAESSWPILIRQVEAAIEHWREPDRGIWEVRGEPKHFTSSKVFCWLACDRGARLARLRSDSERAERWQAAADEIHAEVCELGVDPERGCFVQHYETTALDAALLMIPMVSFLPADDARVRATVFAIADELSHDGLVRRYMVEETDDGLEGDEGSFAICSWWLVSALVEIGEFNRARQLGEKLLAYASPLGLYAEEIDASTGRQLGNFPQAFTHLALIRAVQRLVQTEYAMLAAAPSPGKIATAAGMVSSPVDTLAP
ncbi:MAG: glycoside hydrolase family 15 protein [Solirubrobacteraceae bacterium]|nr:glycoside hydrolase family 15 protein [Solirubrobacteraceae bacterium]